MSKNAKRGKIDPWLFFSPLLFIVLLCAWVLSMPEKAANGLAAAYNFVTGSMGCFFEFYIFAVVIVCAILCVTPLGKKRLGDDPPEFSTFSWLGMIFTAVAGFGVLTWTSIEWFYYAQTPTWSMEPYSAEAMEWASIYPLHHWGPVAFAIATLMGVFTRIISIAKRVRMCVPALYAFPSLGKKEPMDLWGKSSMPFSPSLCFAPLFAASALMCLPSLVSLVAW